MLTKQYRVRRYALSSTRDVHQMMPRRSGEVSETATTSKSLSSSLLYDHIAFNSYTQRKRYIDRHESIYRPPRVPPLPSVCSSSFFLQGQCQHQWIDTATASANSLVSFDTSAKLRLRLRLRLVNEGVDVPRWRLHAESIGREVRLFIFLAVFFSKRLAERDTRALTFREGVGAMVAESNE